MPEGLDEYLKEKVKTNKEGEMGTEEEKRKWRREAKQNVEKGKFC